MTSRAKRVALALLFATFACMAPAASATVCVASASPLAFGIYDPLASGANLTTATVTVTCTPGAGSPLTTPYTITIAGTGTGSDTVRSVVWNGQRLYYQLYSDAARTVVWGNGSSSGGGVASSVTSAATAVPAVRVHTAYAKMAPNQRVAAATYVGSLLVTVDY